MKIQLDTTNKTIKIEEIVNLGELTDVLEKLLPNNEWKEFKLETKTIVEWNNPIIIEPYIPYKNPFTQPWITYDTEQTSNDYKLNYGVYNIEI